MIRIRGGEGAHALERLGERSAAAQVRLHALLTQSEHMAVCVDQPGQQRLAAAIEHLRSGIVGRSSVGRSTRSTLPSLTTRPENDCSLPPAVGV